MPCPHMNRKSTKIRVRVRLADEEFRDAAMSFA